MVVNCTDQNMSGFLRVEDIVGLESKTAVARRQFVDRLPDAWEIREQTERSLEARMIGFGLVWAEGPRREFVDVDKLRARSN